MTDAATELLNLLDVETVTENLFRGIGVGGETSTRIFGGHVIAQALASAYLTVPDDRPCHSLHAYFLRPGNPEYSVDYQVERDRDGATFTTRRVVATQRGRQIFNMIASFHLPREGWEHQHPMPDVQGPDGLLNRSELRGATVDRIPEPLRKDFLRARPIEIHEVSPRDFISPTPTDDRHNLWFRMQAARGCDPRIQHCVLAYASDLELLGSSLRPHGLTWFQNKVMTASLDHSLYFHAPVQFENWHLYTMESPFAGTERSFNRGSIYSHSGRLVASVAQEGLLRATGD